MKVNLYIIQVKTKISSLLREVKISEGTKGVLLGLRTFLFEQPEIKARWNSPPYFEKNFSVGSFSCAQLLFIPQSTWLWPVSGYTLSSFTGFGLPCFLFLKSASYLSVFVHSRNDLLRTLGPCSLACLCHSVHLLLNNLPLLLHSCLWICSVPVLICSWFDIFWLLALVSKYALLFSLRWFVEAFL